MKKLLLMMLLSGVLVQGLEGAAGSAAGASLDERDLFAYLLENAENRKTKAKKTKAKKPDSSDEDSKNNIGDIPMDSSPSMDSSPFSAHLSRSDESIGSMRSVGSCEQNPGSEGTQKSAATLLKNELEWKVSSNTGNYNFVDAIPSTIGAIQVFLDYMAELEPDKRQRGFVKNPATNQLIASIKLSNGHSIELRVDRNVKRYGGQVINFSRYNTCEVTRTTQPINNGHLAIERLTDGTFAIVEQMMSQWSKPPVRTMSGFIRTR